MLKRKKTEQKGRKKGNADLGAFGVNSRGFGVFPRDFPDYLAKIGGF